MQTLSTNFVSTNVMKQTHKQEVDGSSGGWGGGMDNMSYGGPLDSKT